MDTFEGIARFWVLKQRIETQISEVEKVLEDLVRHGLLKQRELHDTEGQTIQRYYQLNPKRLPEIETLLKSQQNI